MKFVVHEKRKEKNEKNKEKRMELVVDLYLHILLGNGD